MVPLRVGIHGRGLYPWQPVVREIVIVQLFDLPARMAHAHQIVHTGRALAARGTPVTLFARVVPERAAGRGVDELLRSDFGFESPQNLRVETVRWGHKGLAGLAYRRLLKRSLARAGVCFYARQRRHALWLLDRRGRRPTARRPAPLAYEFHNLEHVLASEAGRAQDARSLRGEERRLAVGVDALAAISAPLADDVASAFDVPRPRVIPDGVDLESFAAPTREPLVGETVQVVYAGGLYAHKGVDDLVEALVPLPERVHLRVVGGNAPADRERLEGLVASRPRLRGRVTLAGSVPPREVPAQLARADLIALPAGRETRSTRYTSPLKLFEAMAAGVPIVAAPTAALQSVLEDGQTAFIADAHTPAGLARAIERALANPDLARTLGHAAREAARNYGWDARAAAIEAVFAGVAAS